MKVKLNSNMITGVLFLIVSVALHILIPSQIRTYETSAVTAATVPTLLIRGMILCSVILLVQGILSKEKTEYTISGAIFTKENLLRLKPVIYIAMLSHTRYCFRILDLSFPRCCLPMAFCCISVRENGGSMRLPVQM